MTAKLRTATTALAFLAFACLPTWMAAQTPTSAPSSRPITATTSASQPVDKSAVAALIRLLGDDSFRVREKATSQLIEMGWGVRPILEEKLKEKDLELEVTQRMKAVLAKVPFPPVDRAAVAELIKLLGDDSVKAREKATVQLIDMGPSVRPVLSEKLQEKDLDPEVTQRIKLVLAKVPPAPGEEGKIVTDSATGVTFELSEDGTLANITATKDGKMIWQRRLGKAKVETLKFEDGKLVVSPIGLEMDPATGRSIRIGRPAPIKPVVE